MLKRLITSINFPKPNHKFIFNSVSVYREGYTPDTSPPPKIDRHTSKTDKSELADHKRDVDNNTSSLALADKVNFYFYLITIEQNNLL